ncbi:carotenoid oxygenase family protein [Microbacterium sp. 18062]|uniref:carotenoid oxygenase family protein n=1 Tax=Microbacterium sp. 18062 TaxID=2681410 RepID=UPI0013590EA4|nr:carotenoid oxygenase family protein [Microbacterium sp. 18062]
MSQPLEAGAVAPPTLDTIHNPFLEGPFAPIQQEITATDLVITGEIPRELDGRFLRVGPNPIDPGDPATYNWFMGTGMMHGVRIRDGRAEWYRNRFVRDDEVVAKRGGKPVEGPPHLGGGTRYLRSNTVNTHMFSQAGKTWAFAEAGVLPIEVTDELETVARSDFEGTLNGSWTGHPHRDPRTGELHGIAYYWDWHHVSYQVMGVDGRITRRIDVPVRGKPVVHDMALTEKYAIFLDGPVNFSHELQDAGFDFPYAWDFEYETQWVLISRDGTSSDVIRCSLPGQTAVFHILNAYDLPDGTVALDGVSYDRLFVNDRTGPTESPSKLDRFILNPRTGRTTVRRLDDRAQEMPRIDDRRTGSLHQFGYFSSRGDEGSQVLKQHVERGVTESYAYGPGKVGMEAVFVPRHEHAAEDDGWLMTYVSDLATQTAEMVIIPAQDIASGPVARIHIPQRIPLGFHGNWIPSEHR